MRLIFWLIRQPATTIESGRTSRWTMIVVIVVVVAGCSGHLMRTSVLGSLTNTSPMHTCPVWVYCRALKTMATWRQMASVKRSVKSVWTGHGVCFLALFLNSIISHWQQIELRKWWRANTNSNNDWMIYRSDWFLCHHHLQNCQPITFTVFVFYIPAAQ